MAICLFIGITQRSLFICFNFIQFSSEINTSVLPGGTNHTNGHRTILLPWYDHVLQSLWINVAVCVRVLYMLYACIIHRDNNNIQHWVYRIFRHCFGTPHPLSPPINRYSLRCDVGDPQWIENTENMLNVESHFQIAGENDTRTQFQKAAKHIFVMWKRYTTYRGREKENIRVNSEHRLNRELKYKHWV